MHIETYPDNPVCNDVSGMGWQAAAGNLESSAATLRNNHMLSAVSAPELP